MINIKLTPTELDLLQHLVNNDKHSQNPTTQQSAKKFNFENMPIKKNNEYFNKKDIYSLSGKHMIILNPDFHSTVIGRAYLDYVTQ